MKKATFDREFLSEALSKSVKFVPSKAVIPATNDVKVSIHEGKATFTTGDLTTELSVRCPVKSSESFAFCVPAKLLFKTVSSLRENEITLSVKSEKKLEVKCGKSKYNITMDTQAQDFPAFMSSAMTGEFVINEFYLKAALREVDKFTSDVDGSPMAAINIVFQGTDILFHGCNNTTIIRYGAKPVSVTSWNVANIMSDTASRLCALMGDNAEITVSQSDTGIMFSNNGDNNSWFIVRSTQASVKYPNVNRFFDAKYNNAIIVNTMEIRDAMKRLVIYSENPSAPAVKALEVDGSEVVFTSIDSMNNNDAEESVTILGKSNENKAPFSKGFNTNLLINCLSVIETQSCVIEYNEVNNQPVKITPKDSECTDNNSHVTVMVSPRMTV